MITTHTRARARTHTHTHMLTHSLTFTTDIHNWTDITWYESKYAIPHDPIKFFTRFFTQQEGWGLSMCGNSRLKSILFSMRLHLFRETFLSEQRSLRAAGSSRTHALHS